MYTKDAFDECWSPLGPLLLALMQWPLFPRFKHVSHQHLNVLFARQTGVFWPVTDEFTWKTLTGFNQCWSFPTPLKICSCPQSHSNDGPVALHIASSLRAAWSPKMHSFALCKLSCPHRWVWRFWRHKTVLLLALWNRFLSEPWFLSHPRPGWQIYWNDKIALKSELEQVVLPRQRWPFSVRLETL